MLSEGRSRGQLWNNLRASEFNVLLFLCSAGRDRTRTTFYGARPETLCPDRTIHAPRNGRYRSLSMVVSEIPTQRTFPSPREPVRIICKTISVRPEYPSVSEQPQ